MLLPEPKKQTGKKKKKDSRPPAKQEKWIVRRLKGKILRELAAIVLLSLSLFLALSLRSYTAGDPSLDTFTSIAKTPVHNTGGVIGASLAQRLIHALGAGAYCFPVALFLSSVCLFLNTTARRPFYMLSGGISGTLFFCALVSTFYSSDPVFGNAVKPGGETGDFMARNLFHFFNYGGTVIILGTSLILSMLVATQISLKDSLLKGSGLLLSGLKSAWLLKNHFSTRNTAKGAKSKDPEEIEKIKITEFGVPPDGPNKKGAKKNGKENGPKILEAFEPEFTATEQDENRDYRLPLLSFLHEPPPKKGTVDEKELIANSRVLLQKLNDFSIDGKIEQVLPGPVITMYELEPGTGIKVSRILGLADDLALAMKSVGIRIHAPIPGKSVVGIELPNKVREAVVLKDIMLAPDYRSDSHKLTLALGKDTSGKPVVTNLASIPHLLVAGATGSGKSVGINSMITSILFNATPDEVKFIMIDPKMLELSIYDGIPHLIAPVVTNPKKAANALRWAVEEMEKRYQQLSAHGTRNIDGFNALVDKQNGEKKKKGKEAKGDGDTKELKKLPYIVIIIDELADLMIVASKEVEESLARLAQMARAAGIHLLVATQRPSVDVLTGLIKANFPSRISFKVTSRTDSRTILDSIGAERLLGKGDMLFLAPGTSKFQRIHGAFVSETEIKQIVSFLKEQEKPVYDENVLKPRESEQQTELDEEGDELYDQAVELVAKTRQASISMIQRRLRIGYNRSARIVEIMEKQGLVGPSDGSKPREVYVRDFEDVESIT
ncbi:MAG: DNA translocase FtsK 4TM domain-containing protein [Nitrospinota bacterium]